MATLARPRGKVKRRRLNQNSPREASSICPICLDPIIDATEETEGQEAIYCESICNAWIHRQCAGLSQALFKKYEEVDEPFYCPHCRLITQDAQLQDLKCVVENLSMELIVLKAAVTSPSHQLIQESSPQQDMQVYEGAAITEEMSSPDEGEHECSN